MVSDTHAIPWSSIPLIGLLSLTLGLFGFWKYYVISVKKAPKPEPKLTTPTPKNSALAQSQPTLTKEGWQFHQLMKEVSNVPKGVFNYGGAMGSAALRSKTVVDPIARAHPDFRLFYTNPAKAAPDSGTGINMLINGKLSFSESFRPLQQSEYDLAKSRGVSLKQIPVAMGAIAFYSNPELKLPGVSVTQVQKIFSGELTNWKQLGGPNLPIVPITQASDLTPSTSFLLQGLPNSNRHFGRNVKVVRDTTAAIRKVATTPGAISYGSQAVVVGQQTINLLGLAEGQSKNYISPSAPDGKVNKQVLLNGTYPMMRRIFVVVREDGGINEMAGKAYANMLLSGEGQQLVDRVGYLPIAN
jgi:phosphate transport system substrate-binding protein